MNDAEILELAREGGAADVHDFPIFDVKELLSFARAIEARTMRRAAEHCRRRAMALDNADCEYIRNHELLNAAVHLAKEAEKLEKSA